MEARHDAALQGGSPSAAVPRRGVLLYGGISSAKTTCVMRSIGISQKLFPVEIGSYYCCTGKYWGNPVWFLIFQKEFLKQKGC